MRNQHTVSAEDQQRFMAEVYGRVRYWGRRYFTRLGYRGEARTEAIQNAQALAWKHWAQSAAARRHPRGLVFFTLRQVADGRNILGVQRGPSIDGLGAQRRGIKPVRLTDYISYRESPAEVAAFRLDVPAWLATLPAALLRTAWALITQHGAKGSDIARGLGVSPGRLSQRRRELYQRWQRFTA